MVSPVPLVDDGLVQVIAAPRTLGEEDVGDDRSADGSKDTVGKPKRTEPFQFGSRYLTEQDDLFEYNAWDHVETDDEYKKNAERQYQLQRQAPVSDFDKTDLATQDRFNSNPAKWWNLFYKNNSCNFFKNRKWLQQEFPILAEVTKEGAGHKVVLEIGAGAGNTAFPVLVNNKNPQLKIHACDFSEAAVKVMRTHEAYDPNYIQADLWDVSGDCLPPGLDESSVDVAVMLFIFSALSPAEWSKAVDNVYKVLKSGGLVCFRDYGRGDLAQVRFRKGRYLEENFYIRGDGTRVYFFDRDQLAGIWSGTSTVNGDLAERSRFEIEGLDVDRRLLINRAEKIKMHRRWIQGRFRKKSASLAVARVGPIGEK